MKTLGKFLVIGASDLEGTIETFPVGIYDTRAEAEDALVMQLARECVQELEGGEHEDLSQDDIYTLIKNADAVPDCCRDCNEYEGMATLERGVGSIVIEIHNI